MFAYLDSQTSLEDVVLSSSDEEDFIEDCVIDEFPLLTALRLNSLEEKNAKFRRFPDGKLIPVEDYYTELAVVERQAHVSQMEEETASSMEEAIRPLQVYESIYQPSFTIAMKDLFKSENKVADKKSTFSPNRIVLVGRAGVGKTTLCNKLVHDFYREGLWPEKGFAAIVHIPLRELINKSVTSLGAAIREFCLLQRDKQRLSIEVINDTLADENIRDKILYVLDGYDEIAPHLTNNPLLNDLLTSFSEEAHWIITSRPLAIPGSVFDAACDRRVENIGFNTEQVYQFVDCYFNGDEERDEQEIARLLRTGEALAAEIRQNVNLQGIMHVPINSQLVCYVYEQELISINSSRKRTPLQWQDLTMTRLYDKLVYQLVRRYLLRCYEMEKDDKEKQRIQSLHEGRCAEKVLAIPEVKQLLDFLESVAWLAMEKKDILFSFNESKNKSLYDVLKKTSKVHYRRLCLPEKKQQQFERVLQRIREKIRRGEEVKEEKFKAIGTLVTQYPALYSELESLYKSDEDFKDLDPFETFFIKLDLPSDEESTAAMMTSMQNFIRIITQELGLLTNTGEQASVFSEENAYYFLHLTFQEYFAARYMVSHWEEKEVQTFIVKHRYEPRYQQVLGFAAGLLVADENKLNEYFDVLLKEDKEEGFLRDLVGHYEQLLLLHCLEESHACKTLRRKDELLGNLAQWINQLLCCGNYEDNKALQRQLETSQSVLKESVMINIFITPLLGNRYPDEIKKCIVNDGIANTSIGEPFFKELQAIFQQNDSYVSNSVKNDLAKVLGEKITQNNTSVVLMDSVLMFLKARPWCISKQLQVKLIKGLSWGLRYGRPNEVLLWKIWKLLQSSSQEMSLDIQKTLARGLGESLGKGCMNDKLTQDVWVIVKTLPGWMPQEVQLALAHGLGFGLLGSSSNSELMQTVANFLRLPSSSKDIPLELQKALVEGLGDRTFNRGYLTRGYLSDELMQSVLELLQSQLEWISVPLRVNLAKNLGMWLCNTRLSKRLLQEVEKFLTSPQADILEEVRLALGNGLGEGLSSSPSEELPRIVWNFLQSSQGTTLLEMPIKLAKGLGECLVNGRQNDALMRDVLSILQSSQSDMLLEIQLALAEGLGVSICTNCQNDLSIQVLLPNLLGAHSNMSSKLQLALTQGLKKGLLFSCPSEKLLQEIWDLLYSLRQTGTQSEVQRNLALGLGVGVCTGCPSEELLGIVFDFLQKPSSENLLELQSKLACGIKIGLMPGKSSSKLLHKVLKNLQSPPLWIYPDGNESLSQDLRKVLYRSTLFFLMTSLREKKETCYSVILAAILKKSREASIAIWISDSKIHFIENNTQHEIEMDPVVVNVLRTYLEKQRGVYKNNIYAKKYIAAGDKALDNGEVDKVFIYYQQAMALLVEDSDDVDEKKRKKIEHHLTHFKQSEKEKYEAPCRFFNQPSASGLLSESDEEIQNTWNNKRL